MESATNDDPCGTKTDVHPGKLHLLAPSAAPHPPASARQSRDGLVFADTDGGFLKLPNIRLRSFLPIVKRAALPAIRLYDLRHTVATLLLAADDNVEVVSERLSHECPALDA
jgi:integrase